MKEQTVLIATREQDGVVEMEISTTVGHEQTTGILTAAACAAYGISDRHINDVTAFLEALSEEYKKEEASEASMPRTLN